MSWPRSTFRGRRAGRRLFALAIGSALAAGLIFGARAVRAAVDHTYLRLQTSAESFADALANDHQRLTRLDDQGVRARPWRLWLPEDVAEKIFPLKTTGHAYDAYSFFRHRSKLDWRIPWAEHPLRGWMMATNSIGTRDLEEPLIDPDLRILVTGDSHADGVCNNAESFANLCQRWLIWATKSRVDVLNAAKGGYHFYNYLGVLERFESLGLRPDVFVVTVYGGNDFEEALTTRYFFAGQARPRGVEDYWREVQSAVAVDGPCLAQGYLALKYFRSRPAERSVALDVALGVCAELAGRCRSRGIDLVVAYLPSQYELDPERSLREQAKVCDLLGLDRSDLDAAAQMADEFLETLEHLGVRALDLRPTLRECDEWPYWIEDHHLSAVGHRAVARALGPILLEQSRRALQR
jgi:hypothetical protein